MALTDEQLKDIAACGNEAIDATLTEEGAIKFTKAAIAAMPKPEPVVTIENVLMIQRLFESGNMTPNTAEGWKAALEVYTEAPHRPACE